MAFVSLILALVKNLIIRSTIKQFKSIVSTVAFTPANPPFQLLPRQGTEKFHLLSYYRL